MIMKDRDHHPLSIVFDDHYESSNIDMNKTHGDIRLLPKKGSLTPTWQEQAGMMAWRIDKVGQREEEFFGEDNEYTYRHI